MTPRTEAGRRLAAKANELWFQPNALAGANAMESATRLVRDAILAIEAEAAPPSGDDAPLAERLEALLPDALAAADTMDTDADDWIGSEYVIQLAAAIASRL
jgi:hypothetical protein